MWIKTLVLTGALVLAAGVLPATADPLDITNITGVWVNPAGALSPAGIGTSSFTWGDGVPPESGYTYAAAANILGAGVGVPLLLGTFTHINNVIPIPNLTAVDLDLDFDTNGVPGSVGTLFNFAHNETPNTGSGSPADDDIVTIVTPIVNIPITAGADNYFFNLLGFSGDGGATFSSVYRSPEGGSNSAQLYGQITRERIDVPEPVSLLLLGIGLGGLAARRRPARSA